jgi:hypothetical protein
MASYLVRPGSLSSSSSSPSEREHETSHDSWIFSNIIAVYTRVFDVGFVKIYPTNVENWASS